MIELKRACAVSAAALLLVSADVRASSTAAAARTGSGVVAFAVTQVDPVCKVVLDANSKTLDTPNHAYMDGIGAEAKTRTGEMITVNGERYVQVKGTWRKSPMTVAATKAQEEENIKDAKVLSCKRVGDDTVNGEAATVYTEHTENEDTKSDGKIWISKSRGLILKEEIDLNSGGEGKQHVAMRYEYGNVKAPI